MIILGEARDCDELIEIYRARKAELRLTDAVVDYLSGMQSGYTAKLIGPAQIKGLGAMTIKLLNQTLGLKFVVVVDEEISAKMLPRWEGRERPLQAMPNRLSIAAQQRFEPLIARELGRRGGKKSAAGRMQKLTPKMRRKIARKAAKIRWRIENIKT